MNNTKNTVYLLTGAAGFLGGNIARQLIDRGELVRAFVLKNEPAARDVPEECEMFEGDLTDKESLRPFFDVPEGTETVCLHIASIVTVDPDYDPLVMNVNVGGTQNIIDLCLEHPECRRLVYCSSTGAIPELPKGKKIREVSYFDSTKVLGCYSESKAIATQLVMDAVRSRGLDACVVHPSGIMGPNDPAVGETTGVLIQIINGEMPAGIKGSFNLCDVRDLADGVIRAADAGRSGECYILANDAVDFRDFADMVAEEAGVEGIRMFLPAGFAGFLAGLMEKQAKRSGKRPLMTTFSVYNLARNNEFDSDKARSELGYHTRSYRETIRDEIRWLKETGLIDDETQAEISDLTGADALNLTGSHAFPG